jgi:hypothetical protein
MTRRRMGEERLCRTRFCGDDCDACPRYIATQSNDMEQLKKLAVLWHKVGYRNKIVPPEELACQNASRGHGATECTYGNAL